MEWVNHPQHYNSHPSGVEVIEVVRNMGFNLGNAVKYLMRLHEKGTPLQDAKKALWYLEDDLSHTSFSEVQQGSDGLVRIPTLTYHMEKVVALEPDETIKAALCAIFLSALDPSCKGHLEVAIEMTKEVVINLQGV